MRGCGVGNWANSRVESVRAGVDFGGMRWAVGNGCGAMSYGDEGGSVDCGGCALRGCA
jgi:hypothetical protein